MIYELNKRLQEQRKQSKLSQREVAERIHVSPSVISNYESGDRSPSLESLTALARTYHCSTDYLLGLESSPIPKPLDTSMLTEQQQKLLQDFLMTLIKQTNKHFKNNFY